MAMAVSKCPHCQGTFFEIASKEPSGARFKTIFVQCGKCGAPFGVQDFLNIGAEIQDVKKALKRIDQQVDALTYTVSQIAHALSR
jgi:hypothetical protein